MFSIKRQKRVAPAFILAGLAIMCLFSADGFNPVRVAVLGRPDVIDAKLYGSGYSTLSMETVDLTIYEYVDRSRLITTGEGYRFRFPKANLSNTVALGGGTVQWIPLQFDIESGRPISVIEHEMSGNREYSYEEDIRHNTVSVRLSIGRDSRPDSGALSTARKKKTNRIPENKRRDERAKNDRYIYLEKTYAGMDMFDIAGQHSPARENQPYPFTDAVIFARRKTGNEEYDLIIKCNDSISFSWCGVSEPYGRATYLNIFFSGTRLYHVDEVIARARKLLDDHLIEHLPPREGWGQLD